MKGLGHYPDVHFDHSNVTAASFDEYDLFVTTKSFQLDYLRTHLGTDRVAYIPHGFSGRVHRPAYMALQDSDLRTDILYAGNHSSHKQRWMEAVASAFPDSRVHLLGSGWHRAAATGPLANCEKLGARSGAAYAQAIQLARINVAVHWGADSSGWQDMVSTRTFEIPACNGFMLHIDSDEVREFFAPGVEIDVFSSPEELVDKIRFYLPRADLRRQMVERACQRCVPFYSYGARAQQIADLLSARLGLPVQ